MKNLTCVILAGGFGSRISEKTIEIPKPMIEIADKPILIHIIEHYKKFHIKKFIICLGYKYEIIKKYFLNYSYLVNDIKISDNKVQLLRNKQMDADITLINTGLNTNTGGRIKKIEKYLDEDDFFCTYGDGISDVNLKNLFNFHKKKKKIATLTAVRPAGRWGTLKIKNSSVISFREKRKQDTWINGGFFVFNKKIFKYLNNNSILEDDCLTILAKKNKLSAYKHSEFWQAVDTLKDYNFLSELLSKK